MKQPFTDKQSHTPYTPAMKMADLLKGNRKLLSLISRLGMELGVGEKSVDEICRRQEVSTRLFLLLCTVSTCEHYAPASAQLEDLDILELVRFLKASHKYYLEIQLPSLRKRLSQMGGSGVAVLEHFVQNYCNEVVNHYDYEEQTVFPYIEQLIAGGRIEGYDIAQFEKNHSNIDEKLSDLQNIIIKYLPTDSPFERRAEILEEVYNMEDDLVSHALIEDKILVPMVMQLEERHGKKR